LADAGIAAQSEAVNWRSSAVADRPAKPAAGGLANTEDAVADFRAAVYRAPCPDFPDLAIILREDDEVLLCRPVGSVEEGERLIEMMSRGLAELARWDAGSDR
jgi:hypothetical protein